jgi:7-cyano-7-deazaguanine synthase in queuosine biosynthesis
VQATQFVFSGYSFEFPKAIFRYEVTLENGTVEKYEDTIVLPDTFRAQTQGTDEEVLEPFLQSLHLMLGISYWKMYCPKLILLQAGYSLTKAQANFWNTVYTKGLGEFFYKNKLNYHDLVRFPFEKTGIKSVGLTERLSKLLVPLGGGKDSIVTAELLKAKKEPFDFFVINSLPLHQHITKIAGQKQITVQRVLDAKLIEKSAKKSVYVGHVPMTAIYRFVALFVAAIAGHKAVVISTEQSANYGNVKYLGEEINHQWSKSQEFDHLLNEYLKTSVSTDVKVYSLLSEKRELDIVEMFTKYPAYFEHFTSCNRNFAHSGNKNADGKLWCGECPKCAFMFAMLAAYLPKDTVVGIFKKNLFAEEKLKPLYRELLGKEAFKPFECVGTPEETREAFTLAHKRGEFEKDTIMQMFVK